MRAGLLGRFGFKAVMTVPIRRQDAGLFANLFRFNSIRKALELMSSSKIDKDGNAALEFNHASEYVIVVANRSLAAGNITSVVDGRSVKLSWDMTFGATGYTVYTYEGGELVDSKTTTKTELTVKKLKNNTEYKFVVKADVEGELTEVYSLTVKVCFRPVLKAELKDGKISLNWSEVDGATKYRVMKYVNGKWKKVSVTKKTLKKIKNAKKGKKYRFAVQAYVDGKWTKITKVSKVTVKVN